MWVLLFYYSVHGAAEHFRGVFCFGGALTESLTELAGAGKPGEQPVEVAGEDGGGCSLGEFLFYVGQVGFEKGFAG